MEPGKTPLPRLRTAAGALAIIQQEDPESEVTLHYLRRLVKTGKIPCVPVGRKKLIDVDRLLVFLSEGGEAY